MGQRSQIYIRGIQDGKNYLIARDYSWNYGERMISRCRHTIEWLLKQMDYTWLFTTQPENLKRILDVNFDMGDVMLGGDITTEYETFFSEETYNRDFSTYIFREPENNDGKLFIDIVDRAIKYAFLDSDCNTENIMDAEQYMKWDFEDWRESKYIPDEQKKLCEENLKAINRNATLMTKEEVESFIRSEYENAPKTSDGNESDRLTRRVSANCYRPRSSKVNGEFVTVGRCVHRLGMLEDLEQQKRLIMLPCVVGDTLWAFEEESHGKLTGKVINVKVEKIEIAFDSKGQPFFRINDMSFELDCLETTLFYSKEQAESALKQMMEEE